VIVFCRFWLVDFISHTYENLMRRKTVFYSAHVLLPILLGGMIYILCRKSSLLMFAWYDRVGLGRVLEICREAAEPSRESVPRWFLYSLPGGLWVYSMTAFMSLVWRDAQASFQKSAWVSVALVLGVGSEFLQVLQVVPGTFDPVDLVLYCFSGILALILIEQSSIDSTVKEWYDLWHAAKR